MEQSMTAVEAARLIDWLKANGHSAEEATECIKYIATGIQRKKIAAHPQSKRLSKHETRGGMAYHVPPP